ncbi:MAG: hypothetical protein ACOC5T_04985 [Elusimicrobiota bacterium]
MRKNRGHYTTKAPFIAAILKSHGKTEMKFRRDGLWRKIANGQIITGETRAEVRNKAKA